MIRFVEALNYRCLRYVARSLDDLQILVGPNASGKTTFLDVVAFLGDLLSQGLEQAIRARAKSIEELFFFREGRRFELGVELAVPEERLAMLPGASKYPFIRYEVSIGIDEQSAEYHILDEQVVLMTESSAEQRASPQRELFPMPLEPPDTIMHSRQVGSRKRRTVRKVYEGNDNYYSEVQSQKGKGGWAPSIRLGPRKSALANMPEDEKNFPVSTWLRDLLINGTQKLMLNSMTLRQSSPPGLGRLFRPDGTNLPWVVEGLRSNDMDRFRQWVNHVRTALPDINDIETVELPDTRHRFLQIVYQDQLKVPSWTVSDGTLRMLALTLLAYLPEFKGIYLIEEPENGIHPLAIETVYQSLSSVYDAQMLVATHSPVILGCAEADEVLCFKKDNKGATDIVSGSEHPGLRQWQGALNLSELYASGVLG